MGPAGRGAIASASWDVIDAEDRVTGKTGPDPSLWTEADRSAELEKLVGAPVYAVKAGELLRRCLGQMKNPFNFAATVYATELYQRVEGYGGGRLYNPDKWFHWKVLGQADMAYFVDRTLFAYRWHGDNQVAQESATSALKFLVDEYVSTLEIDAAQLGRLGLSRDDVLDAFVEHDIARHGLATLARGQRLRARRILDFGRAAYPQHVRRNRHARALGWLLIPGKSRRNGGRAGLPLLSLAKRPTKSVMGAKIDVTVTRHPATGSPFAGTARAIQMRQPHVHGQRRRMSIDLDGESRRIIAEYERREREMPADFYDLHHLRNLFMHQEHERLLAQCLHRTGQIPSRERRILEVGCGHGNWLSVFETLGFPQAEHRGYRIGRSAGRVRREAAADGRCPRRRCHQIALARWLV